MKLFAAASLLLGATAQTPPTPASILQAMEAANSYFVTHNAPGDCGWTRGTFYDGQSALYEVSKNASVLAYLTGWAVTHNYSCSDGKPANDFDANNQCAGHAYARLYEAAPADYKLAMSVTLSRQILNVTVPTLWNWVDALFMALPTWMKYGALLGDTRYWTTAWANYQWTAYGDSKQPDGVSGLWDPTEGLFFRDATYFNKSTPSGKKVFWARGCGWAIASFAESIEALPTGHAYADEFKNKIVVMAAALKPQQGADGLWRASLLDSSEFPNPETTGSALFTYAMAWAVRNGVLDKAVYTPIVYAAWAGLAGTSLQPNGLVGWCQPANGQPAGTTQNSTSDFCVGNFLMAGAEVYRLVSAK